MKFQVQFTVDVDYVDDKNRLGLDEITAAVAEAVTNAMSVAQANGHNHTWDNEIAILMDSQVIAKPA